MLTIYRRHLKTCAHRSEGRNYRRCRCAIWVDGFIGKEEIRRSLRAKNWERAQAQVREWEAQNQITPEPEGEPVRSTKPALDSRPTLGRDTSVKPRSTSIAFCSANYRRLPSSAEFDT